MNQSPMPTPTVDSPATVTLRGHQFPVDMYIDGAWVGSGNSFAVTNPANGEILAEVADGGSHEAVKALDAAVKAQPKWGAMIPRQRAALIRNVYELLRERAEQFVDIMVLESGKPRAEAEGEFELSAAFLLWYSEQIAHLHGAFGQGSAAGYRVITTHQPVGPSLLITPWNFPLLMGARKMGAALAAGCTVVIKSAQQTPLTIALLVRTLEDAGIPAGVVNLVHTTNSAELSRTLMRDRRLRKVSFTGSTTVGAALLAQAAPGITNASMELGGNGPFIVLDDADVDLAVREAIACKFRNAGQACVAANRIILHSAIAEEFTRKFVAATKALTVGDGFTTGVDVGPMISEPQRERIDRLVLTSVASGSARLLAGGSKLPGAGYFYQPTVLSEVDRAADLSCDELFGPVAVLYTVDSIRGAVDFANETEYGLAAYLFTRDISRAIGIAERIESGMVGINRGIMADPAAPFGGIKSSGLGREGGEHALHEFLETKYIALTIGEDGFEK